MQINQEYYIYCHISAQCLPSKALVKSRQLILDKLQTSAPWLLQKTKRFMPNQKINRLRSIKPDKAYPFRNGLQPETKGGVVWTDYKLSYWPLLIALLKLNRDKTYAHIVGALTTDKGQGLNWDALRHLLHEITTPKSLRQTDELDRWYDEISATLILPASYHALYYRFGDEVQQIGYDAFDFFMEERNGTRAWQKALEKHLKAIPNLPVNMQADVMNTDLLNLLSTA